MGSSRGTFERPTTSFPQDKPDALSRLSPSTDRGSDDRDPVLRVRLLRGRRSRRCASRDRSVRYSGRDSARRSVPVLLSDLLDPDREAAVTDRRSVDRRLSAIERHLRALDEDLSVLGSAVRLGEPPDDPDSEGEQEASAESFSDVVWSCERCPARLAIYDPVDDLLRLRHRDFIAHIRTGRLGFVRVVCRGCGHINEIHDEPSDSDGEPEARTFEARPDLDTSDDR
jgi:hypothetical protein